MLIRADLDPEPDSFWYNIPKHIALQSPFFSTASFGKTTERVGFKSKKWTANIQSDSKRCRPPKGYVTINTAAKLIGISSRGLRKAYERGKLSVIVIDGGIYVLPSDVVAYRANINKKS